MGSASQHRGQQQRGQQQPQRQPAARPTEDELRLARIAELEQQLQEARAEAGMQDAPPDAGEKLLSVFEQLLERVNAAPQAKAVGTFGQGESVDAIASGALARISVGEHSGAVLDPPVTFRARGADKPGGCNFNIVRKAQHRTVLESGEAVFSLATHYNFAPSGYFTTDDEDVAAYIRRSPGYGVEVMELGAEQGDVPSPGPVLDRIMQARIDLDVEALDEIEHRERGGEGWKRPVVLEAIAATRRSMARAEQELEVPA